MSTQAIFQRKPGAMEIRDWLIEYLSRELNVAAESIDITAPFDRHGLSSLKAVLMIGDLEEWLGHSLDPTLPYDYPTIELFANHIGSMKRP